MYDIRELLCKQDDDDGAEGSVLVYPVHKGITIVLSLFRSHWKAVVYCLVLCIGSETVHEDRATPRMRAQ